MKKLFFIAAALALIAPQYAFAEEDVADMGFWENVEMMPMEHSIPYIINYQITADGARIFGILSGATNGVEVFDNGVSLGGRLKSLPNSVFSLEIDKPLDVNKNHSISIRGWNDHNEPVKINSPYVSNDENTQVTVVFTAPQLQEQRTSFDQDTLRSKNAAGQTVSPIPAAVSGTPVTTSPTTNADQQSSKWLFMLITFLVIFAIGLIFYYLSKRRRGGKPHDGEGHSGVHGSP